MTTTPPEQTILFRLVEQIQQLYTLPAVAMKVMRLTNMPQVDTVELKRCIEQDPALMTRILRVVNSSIYGLNRQVSDLNEAIAVLGIKPLKLLVLGFSLPKNLLTGIEKKTLQRYWQNALTKAIASREISNRYWKQHSDDAFVAGLLQNVGMLALIQHLGEPYVDFLDKVFDESGELAQLETASIGFDHTVLSARLLERWQLPSPLVRAVGRTHDAQQLMQLPERERPLPQILHLAELVAQCMSGSRQDAVVRLVTVGTEYCGLTLGDVEEILPKVEAQVTQLAEVLSIDLDQMGDYTELLEQSQAQLAAMAEETVSSMIASPNETLTCSAESENLSRLLNQVGEQPVQSPTSPPVESAPASPPELRFRRKTDPPALVREENANHLDPGLQGRITSSIAKCRQNRMPISLALVEIDDFEELLVGGSLSTAQQMMQVLKTAIAAVCDPGDQQVAFSSSGYAIILEDCDRQQSCQIAKQLSQGIRRWSQNRAQSGQPGIRVSIGLSSVMLPPKNFPAIDLFSAARRCLDGAKLSGGDTMKSIDV